MKNKSKARVIKSVRSKVHKVRMVRARIVFCKTLRSQLENSNFLELIVFLIDEHSNSPAGEYARFSLQLERVLYF